MSPHAGLVFVAVAAEVAVVHGIPGTAAGRGIQVGGVVLVKRGRLRVLQAAVVIDVGSVFDQLLRHGQDELAVPDG
jgi:hypothetical protein